MQTVLRIFVVGLFIVAAVVLALLRRLECPADLEERGGRRGNYAWRGLLKYGSIKLQIVLDVSQMDRRSFRVALVRRRRDAVSPAGDDEP